MKYLQLTELAELINGSTPLKSNKKFWDNGTINWFTAEDLRNGSEVINTNKFITKYALDNTSIKLVPKDSVLLCCTASIGLIGINKIELTTNQQFNAIVPNKELINFRYLFYFLKSYMSEFEKKASTTTVGFISQKKVKSILVPVPSLQEQEKIVERLDKVFENIDKKINQKLALNNEYKKYLNSYIENKIFQDTNPVKLRDLINIKRENIKNYKEKFVGLENIVSNTSEVINVESVTVKSNTYKFNKGSLLYGRLRPYLNKVAIVDFDGHCSTEIIPIETTEDLNKNYLKHFLMTQKTVNRINLQTTGARMPRASVSVLENLEINLKNEKEQNNDAKIFDNLSDLTQKIIENNLKITKNCNLLKSSLLNKEFSYE